MTNNPATKSATASAAPSEKLWLRMLTSLANYFEKPTVLEGDTLAIYRKALEPMTQQQLTNCHSEAIARCRFMPKVAELLEFAGQSPKALESAPKAKVELEADYAWEQIVKAAPDWQFSLKFRPPEMTAAGDYAVRIVGGWDALYNAISPDHDGNAPDGDSVHWMKKNWREAYLRYTDTDGLKALPRSEARRLLAGVKGLLQ